MGWMKQMISCCYLRNSTLTEEGIISSAEAQKEFSVGDKYCSKSETLQKA